MLAGYRLRARQMQSILCVALASAAFIVCAASTAAAVPAADVAPAALERALFPCHGTVDIDIRAAVPRDADAACEGARRALVFLARAGLGPPPGTTIEITTEMPAELGGRAVGCYLRETRRILLLPFQAFEAGGQWFQMPTDLELYKSVAAHEIAHAVVGCHSEPARLPVAAHEYVAYVVTLATMEPRLRERLLAKFPGTGFGNTLQINEINYIANPNQFGADAWRHYLRRSNGAAWLREIISGKVVQELPSEGP